MDRLFEDKNWDYYKTVVPIMLFFFCFLIWATFSDIDEVVKGSGKVVPSGQTKILQNLEGGIVANILLQEGDKVKAGDVIYTLSNEFFKADLITKELDLLSFQVVLERLQASIDGKEKITFSEELTRRIPDIVQNETKIFYEDLESTKGKIGIAQDQYNQKEYKLKEAQIRHDNLTIELNLAQENMRILDELLKKKVVSRKEYIAELAKKQNIVTKIEEARNSIPILEQEVEESKRKIDAVKFEIRNKILTKYSEVKNEIYKSNEKNRANKDRELRKQIVSPVNGVINKLHFYTIGGIVKPGDIMAEITPVDDSLTIEAKIKSSDRAFIWPSQNVTIEITAYDYSKYGLLNGKLVSISADSFEDKMGNTHYIAKIEADTNQFAPDLPILPGMVANINILTGKQSVLHYILKPLKDIRKNALVEQ